MAAAITAGAVSMAVYAWTAAPNVTLLDSGEFITAAARFGVPHPTGYPLWTLLNWLFLLLPLGNVAWEVNLFSGVCAALAVALMAGVLVNLLKWFLGDLPGRLALIAPLTGTAFALLLAFSVPMWSQAVIAEVYGLHVLLIAVYLALLYGWVRHPSHDRLLLGAFFVLALAVSNHHLSLTLAPLPFLLVLLLRRRALPDWIFASVLTALLFYLGFAILSEDQIVLKTAIRFFWIVVGGGVVFVVWRRGRIRWRLTAFLPFSVGLGLLPYAYMPLASATNPPMNWSYTRDPAGFFYSINRSQYTGTLSDQSLRTLGKLAGTASALKKGPEAPRRLLTSKWSELKMWVGFFWQQLARAFTPFSVIGYFASILFILRCSLPKRTWIYTLHMAFVLAAFLLPAMEGAPIDKAGWWLQMPWHGYTFLIYALLSGLGIGLLIEFLARRRALYFWLAPILLLLPLWTAPGSAAQSSQRGRLFGWMFGHDMLKDLPQGAVVMGGTDPGRFVPTYMIFGESPQSAGHKRDPAFDRRDLYIITQNALGEPLYMKYIRDHYGVGRPKPRNAFERWLGRGETYPEQPLILPSPEETDKIIAAEFAKETKKSPEKIPAKFAKDTQDGGIYGAILRWIWERNRDKHEFFIEESFPIPWTYDYAVPHGLVYRLNSEKLDSLTPEMVSRDFAFWAAYKAKLLADPAFKDDFDAQRSFSKLRLAMANVYRHRKMLPEAERAYREALELWTGNPEAILPLCEILEDRGDYDAAFAVLNEAFQEDPNNMALIALAVMTGRRKEAHEEIEKCREALDAAPNDAEAFTRLLTLYASMGDTNRANQIITTRLHDFTNQSGPLKSMASYLETTEQPKRFQEVAELLVATDAKDPMHHYILARALMVNDHAEAAFESAARAVREGGRKARELLAQDPVFAEAIKKPPFDGLLRPQAAAPGGTLPIPKE